MNLRLFIFILVTTAVSGCGPTGYLNYGKPEFADESKLDSLIGERKEVILDIFGPPDELRATAGTTYYIYSEKGNSVAFYFLVPVHPYAGMEHCLLLKFNNHNALTSYQYESDETLLGMAYCDGMISKGIGFDISSEEFLMNESKIGNASAMYGLYKKKLTRNEVDLALLCESADKGYYKAQVELGYLYYYGLYNIEQDIVKSHAWYSFAKKSANGKINVQSIHDELTPEQLQRADAYINTWKAGNCIHEVLGVKHNNDYTEAGD